MAKCQRLHELMIALEDHCAGCWARDGRLMKTHDRPVSNCIGATNGSSQWEEVLIQGEYWSKFFQNHMRLEQKFKYCYWCRLPQEREYKPICHSETPTKDNPCKYKWKIEHALGWMLGGGSNFEKVCKRFGLDKSISAERLADWLKRESSPNGFNYTIEVLLWFAEAERGFIFTDTL